MQIVGSLQDAYITKKYKIHAPYTELLTTLLNHSERVPELFPFFP